MIQSIGKVSKLPTYSKRVAKGHTKSKKKPVVSKIHSDVMGCRETPKEEKGRRSSQANGNRIEKRRFDPTPIYQFFPIFSCVTLHLMMMFT